MVGGLSPWKNRCSILGPLGHRPRLPLLPHIGIVVLAMYDDDDSVVAALSAGARGYLLKWTAKSELRSAVLAAAEGHAVFGSRIAAKVLRRATTTNSEPAFPQLTAREEELLNALIAGLGPAAIGARLGISPKTVRNNISAILTKLSVNDRSQAVALARAAGLGERR
jgi:DNA-binding NarL/FixJ family response regulator